MELFNLVCVLLALGGTSVAYNHDSECELATYTTTGHYKWSPDHVGNMKTRPTDSEWEDWSSTDPAESSQGWNDWNPANAANTQKSAQGWGNWNANPTQKSGQGWGDWNAGSGGPGVGRPGYGGPWTTTAATPLPTAFNVLVSTSLGKRASNYVGLQGGKAFVVSDITQAAVFSYSQGVLTVGLSKIGTHSNVTEVMQIVTSPFSTWGLAGNILQYLGSTGFCWDAANFIEIVYGPVLQGCTPVRLIAQPIGGNPPSTTLTTTTTGIFANSTTSSTISSTTNGTTTTGFSNSTTTSASSTTVSTTSTTSVAPGSTQTFDVTGLTYINAMLAAHNVHRTGNHSESALVWNTTLANIAALTASSCIYAHDVTTGGGGYGQNIGAGAAGNAAAGIINNGMYNGEINAYPQPYGLDNPDMSNFGSWGHYSQIVWASTTSVGCATQYCPNGLQNTGPGIPPYFTVCNYYPPGNFGGQYSNVKAPQGQGTIVFIGS